MFLKCQRIKEKLYTNYDGENQISENNGLIFILKESSEVIFLSSFLIFFINLEIFIH
jgi:uncharacterized membrane protein (UPF0127 family)